MKNQIYFLHGLESSGSGTKGRFFAKNFPQVVCPDFEGALQNRLDQLEERCRNHQHLLLIGSSFGGLMATLYAKKHPEKVTRLILLAPALNFADYQPPAKKLLTSTLLIIGTKDTVTPADLVVPLAEATFANFEVRIENDDHMLHDTFRLLEWQELLAYQCGQ